MWVNPCCGFASNRNAERVEQVFGGYRIAHQYEAARKIAARLRSTSVSVVAHEETLIRIAV
jgi:hypothetical protein